MRGAFVKPLEYRPRGVGHVADGIILADERLDRLKTVEPHQRLKLDFIAGIAAHQVDVAKARDVPSLDARNYLPTDDAFISIGIPRRGPAAPNAADHHTRIGIST